MATYMINERPILLKEGDTIIFPFKIRLKDLTYMVTTDHVSNRTLYPEGGDNDRIFTMLGMDWRAKVKFAMDAYGYENESGGDWPCCNHGDFPALTRLVLALYDFIQPNTEEFAKINVSKTCKYELAKILRKIQMTNGVCIPGTSENAVYLDLLYNLGLTRMDHGICIGPKDLRAAKAIKVMLAKILDEDIEYEHI